ncbi:MAG: hypothetical protein KJ077_27160 [Anaerolineae bacterium]|nr:hypothetical protein [Anaerolineae bacterium]
MSESLLGLTITRAIPPEVLMGLMTGQYKLYGGVIRWANGTEYAGQIVRHLVPVAGSTLGASLFAPVPGVLEAVNTYQLHKLTGQVNALSATTQQVLQIATGTMILSGLNLAVSAVGFAVLNDKLKILDGKLNELQKEVKAIRALLELEERARLGAALRDLLNIVNVKNPDNRHTMLFNSKNVLAPISLKYKELLARAETIETAMAYEEYFCLTSLAHARCLAELGMLEMAHRDLDEANNFWKEQARRIANEFLLGKYPERFLFSDFAQDVPVSILVEWLDFIRSEEKGYAWIDELRSKTSPWYADDDYNEVSKGAAKVTSSLWGVVSRYSGSAKTRDLDREREMIIPSFQKLVARNKVLEGYITQYKLLEEHNVTPSEFEGKMALLAPEVAVDGYIILQPAQSEVNG